MNRNRSDDGLSSKYRQARDRLRVVWDPDDFAEAVRDFDRHSDQAVDVVRQAIERDKARHPGFAGRAQDDNEPCPVVNIFTRQRVR